MIGKIGRYKLLKRFDSSEPQSCEGDCGEDLNGLNYFYLEISRKFKLGSWLCNKCAKEFIKTVKSD